MAEKQIKTIGVLTSGGDAPGMNAAIRAVVRRGLSSGLNVKGIYKGYNGLLNEEIVDMTARDVSDTIERGGTILYTARCAEFRTPEGQQRGAEICKKHGIDGLVVIGGDGSFAGAQKLANLGINTIGVPGTIDLDIACTEYTIGFDTAVNTAMEAIDKVRDTSTSHERCSIIEVMGRNAGYLAMWCGIANGAEDVLIPEKYDYDEQKLINNIIASRKAGKKHHIIVNAEGIGHSEAMARRIEAATGIETRATILGHMQRGGNPTCKDRVYASMMGALAVDLLVQGKSCRVVGYRHGEFMDFDINEAPVSPYMWEVCNSLSHIDSYDYDEQKLINNIIASRKAGKKHHIIVNAEGIGHSEAMARRIEAATGIETRATILGHMQRGGNPTCKDRVYASMMGALAVDLLVQGKSCRVVGYRHGEFMDFDINEALAMQKDVSPYMWEVCNSLSHNYKK